MEPRDHEKHLIDQHQKNRESLLANEAFTLTMQQVVAGGILIGTISKFGDLKASFGAAAVAAMILLAGASLIAAVIGAQLRHEYRMWDVKTAASPTIEEARVNSKRAALCLELMRRAMWIATALSVAAIALVIVGALASI